MLFCLLDSLDRGGREIRILGLGFSRKSKMRIMATVFCKPKFYELHSFLYLNLLLKT